MDYLCECSTDRDRREALKQLPPDLLSSYERILERVYQSNKQNQRLVRNTLHWIVYVEDPLTTKQLLQALAVQSGDTVFDSSGMTTEEELLHWCSSLVRRNRSSTGLELAHFTVKEFLISIDPILKPGFRDYQLPGDHSSLTEACVTFLKCKSFDDRPISSIDPGSLFPKGEYLNEVWEPFKEDFSFIEYAGVNWDTHLRQCQSNKLHGIVPDMFIPEHRSNFRVWTFFWFQDSQDPRQHKFNFEYLDPSPLHWAACFAFADVCEILIELGMDVNKESKFGRPLNCALKLTNAWDPSFTFREGAPGFGTRPGQKETIQLLLNARANAHAEVHVSKDRRSTAFRLAFEADMWLFESYTAIKTMLDSGCTILSEDFNFIPDDIEEYTDDPLDCEICCRNANRFVKTLAGDFGVYLQPSSYLDLFSFTLQMLALGSEAEDLPSLFSIKFQEIFPSVDGQELDRLLNTAPEDRQKTLI
jgi:hypothetical protein